MGRHISVETWLERVMTYSDERGAIAAISLNLAIGQYYDKYTEVHGVRFGNKTWTAKELAEEFHERAEIYVKDHYGSFVFALVPYYQNDLKTPGTRHTFRIQGGSDEETGVNTDPNNEKGMSAQLMRAFDTNSQIAQRGVMGLSQQLMQVNEFMSDQVMRLMKQNMESHQMMAELWREKNAQDHEKRLKEIEAERWNSLISKGANLLPAFLESLTGVKSLPEATVETSLLEQMADEITADPSKAAEKAKILGSLFSQETATMLADKLTKIITERRKEKSQLSLVKPDKDATHN